VNIKNARVLASLLALSAAYVGAWTQVAPQSFHESFPGLGQVWVAPLGPYNEHLIRDVGGLYLALTVFTAWAALRGEVPALRAAGLAWLAFGVPHTAFHLLNRHGFSDADWAASLTPLIAAVAAAALLVFMRESSPLRPASKPGEVEAAR
jgi:hypothetical protein